MLQALADKMAQLAVRAVARLRGLGKPARARRPAEVVSFSRTREASPAAPALRAGGAASSLTREQLLQREPRMTPAILPGPVAQLLHEVGYFAAPPGGEARPLSFAAEAAKPPPPVSTRQGGPAAQLLAERDTYTPIYVQRQQAAEF